MHYHTLDITNFPDCLYQELNLDEAFINETLGIYYERNVYLKQASYKNLEIDGVFRIEHYPFTKVEYIDYVTAPMLFLYVAQLGYVFVRCLVQDGIIPLSINHFFEYRNAGKIMFCSFDKVRMRKKLPDILEYFSMKISLVNFHETASGIFGKIQFSTESGEHYGLATVQINH